MFNISAENREFCIYQAKKYEEEIVSAQLHVPPVFVFNVSDENREEAFTVSVQAAQDEDSPVFLPQIRAGNRGLNLFRFHKNFLNSGPFLMGLDKFGPPHPRKMKCKPLRTGFLLWKKYSLKNFILSIFFSSYFWPCIRLFCFSYLVNFIFSA